MALLMNELSRRGAAALAMAIGTGVLVSAGGVIIPAGALGQDAGKGEDEEDEGEKEVTATEDLMREHGILRRILIVYSELASRLRAHSGKVDPMALADAAKLFREFGEEYHERTLEEQFIFPEVRKTGGANEKLVEVLLLQHQRGREITDYLYRVGSDGQIGGHAEPLADALAAMARMYEPHATWEDTVIFPAWKKSQSQSRLDDLADKFDEIERERFGGDGFEQGLQRVGRIEDTLGLSDLAAYTAPPAPRG